MAFYTTIRAPSAIFVGVFFTAITCAVLLDDVWHGAAFTTKHLMTLAVLAGTVYFGHRFQIQLRAWKLGTAFGCAVLFLAGTLACVVMSAGRNAEVVVTKALTVNASNSGRAAAQKDRDEAKARYDAALTAETAECASGNGTKCGAKRITRMVRRQEYDEAEAKLRTEKPEQVANADVKAAAQLFARLPFVQADAGSIEALLLLTQPFLLSLFCEVGAILGFGIGLGHGRKDLPEAKPKAPEPSFPASFPSKTSRKHQSWRVTDAMVLEALETAAGPLANFELADRLGISDGECSKTVARMNGQLQKVRVGHCMMISLRRKT